MPDAFDAHFRALAAPVAVEGIEPRLAEVAEAARVGTEAEAAALLLDGDVPRLAGPFDVDAHAALLAEAHDDHPAFGTAALAVPVDGLTGVSGVLAVQGAALEAGPALVRLLRLAALAGRLVAFRQHRAALDASAARARAILDTTVDGVITIDEAGTMASFNPAAERIFGLRAADVIGQNVAVLMPEPYRSGHAHYLHHYLATGERRIIGIGREVTGRRADGTVFPMELAVSETWLGARRVFTGLVRDISDRRQLEQEVLRASEEERTRIGQDLHDGLGQMLTGVSLIARGLARQARATEPALADQVGELAGMLREADEYARTIARGLVPVDLTQGGLQGGLERLAANAERLLGVACTCRVEMPAPLEDPTTAMHLYRIAQEAVSNAVRHGGARAVAIQLASTDAHVRLTVQDDGRGFGAEVVDRPERGAGLRIMHYRARLIGAALDVASRPGAGTTITVRFNRTGETPARSLDEQLLGLPVTPRPALPPAVAP